LIGRCALVGVGMKRFDNDEKNRISKRARIVSSFNPIANKPGGIVPLFMVFLIIVAILPLTAQSQNSPVGSSVSTYIVVFKDTPGVSAAASSNMVADLVSSYGGNVKYRYSIINGMAVTIPDSQLSELSSLPNVKYVEKDGRVQIQLNESVPHIGVDQVWDLGYDGSGIKVCVIDTGIDANHPDLNNGKVIAWADFVNGLNSMPYDDHGHGTHVSSIIAGTGNASGGLYKGVAPGVSLMGVKVLDGTANGWISDVIEGINWATENHAQIISLSLGNKSHNQSMDDAIDNAVSQGIVAVISAGNNGDDYGTIKCPADDPNAITVGALDKNDVITSFSSRGPTWDGHLKPDVTNIGMGVHAARAWYNSIPTYPSGSYPIDDYYTTMSGTSMAAPMTSGVVALMWQKNPSLTPAQVQYVLQRTAIPLGSEQPNNVYGWGRVCANYAVDNATFGSLRFNLSSYYVNESDGTVTLNVTKTGNTVFPVSVNYATANGTALAGVNYQARSGMLMFQPTDTYRTFTVNIEDDGLPGVQKYFTVDLSSPANATLTSPGSSQVFINDTSIVTDFTCNVTSGTSPLTVQFNDTSICDNIDGWSWNFSDGTGNFTTQNITHTFTNAGPASMAFAVTLTVSNASGSGTRQVENCITVNPQPPLASFMSNMTTGTAPLTVQFTDTSTGTRNGWQWDFGDGTGNATIGDPVHTFNSVGNYTVTLTVSNAGGSSTITRVDHINVTGPALESYTLLLNKGWNLVSIPLVPQDTNISNMIPADVKANLTIIWAYDNLDPQAPVWKFYKPARANNTLPTITEKTGYWFLMTNNSSMRITGSRSLNDTIVINDGWNLVGCPSMTDRGPSDLFGDYYLTWGYKNDQWSYYKPTRANNTLSAIEPGYGYWVLKM
jgi:subtilisin family serine protease